MKIDYTSDIHLDWVIPITDSNQEEKFKLLIENKLKPNESSEAIIIAGDIGHRNIQNVYFFQYLKNYYDNVIFTLGNHDMHIYSYTKEELFDLDSRKRVSNLKSLIESKKNIHFLDGNIIKINNISIGGSMGWYDGSFIYKNFYNKIQYLSKEKREEYLLNILKEFSRDPYDMYNISHWKDLFKEEYNKLEKIINSDIIVSHFQPSNNINHFSKNRKYELSNAFWSFDGDNLIKKSSARYWIFGHSHEQRNFRYNNIEFLLNSFMRNQNQIKTIEI